MKKLILSTFAGALLLPAVGHAGGPPAGRVTAYLTNSTVDFGGGSDDSGTGFGVRGWGMLNPNFFIHGEYQTVETDDFEIPIDQLRVGGGWAGGSQNGPMWLAFAEYIDFGDFDTGFDQSGFGLHGGVVLMVSKAVSVMGTAGYVTTDDTDGVELNVGGHFAINPQWGIDLDYRTYLGSVDPSGDLTLSDLRAGVSFTF